MKGFSPRYLIAGLALIGLVNAVILASVAWNRQPPAQSQLLLSERELGSTHTYWRKDNSSLALRLDYRWPSQADNQQYGLSISAEKMAALGFQVPAQVSEAAVSRYRRQLDREALLVLELDGPAYQREVALARAAHAAALRLQASVPGSKELQDAAKNAGNALEYEEQRASRLLVVDVGADQQALRARYPDRQRYAIVRGIVEARVGSVVSEWTGEGQDPRPQSQRVTWLLGGSASTPGLHSLNLPRRWHATFDSLPQQDELSGMDDPADQPRFTANVALGRRLEPWFVEVSVTTTKVQ